MTPTTDSDSPRPDPDAIAAHEFLAELRTRITTQPLPYQYGSEARALESLWEVFGQAREAMKRNPGCQAFAAAVTQLLNVHLRPVTAKWDRAHADGRLDSRDGADEFRADLAAVQIKLREFAKQLQAMAYGTETADELTPPAMTEAALDEICRDVRFGIDRNAWIPDAIVASINLDEMTEVTARRSAYGIQGARHSNAVGLGLSGGGIRSATFCLGVVQVLAERELLKDVDFLSTVSGGGYTGSFLTARLGAGADQSDVAGPHGPDPKPIRYLRQHAKYLTAIDLKQGWSMVTATFAGMLLNWTAPILLVVAAALATRIWADRIHDASAWPVAVGVAGALTLISLLLYGALLRQRAKVALFGGSLMGLLMAATLFIAVGWLLYWFHEDYWLKRSSLNWRWPGIVAALVAAGPAIMRFIPIFETPAARRIVLKGILYAAGVVVPLICLVLFYSAVDLGRLPITEEPSRWNPLHYMDGTRVLVIVIAALAAVSIFILNINLTGLHRMYRDLLAATFIRKAEDDPATVPLEEMNPAHRAPYHLLNTTVNLPSSTNPALRDRKADFFLFSKRWSGSPIVGYNKTGAWKMNAARPDLATAMAVSGAAASSHMGLDSMPTLVALLTFLNIRLGFWIRRPGHNHFPEVPGFTCLMREMTGVAMSEKREWLNLSDGGHIENMGVYELLRRRCKYVICVDGEADGGYLFPGLMTLIRHAQLDFGIRMEPHLDPIRPNAESRHSQAHATLFRIHYPAAADGRPAATGLFLYLKLSVTGNESELIRRYRTICPDFPHQSTVDQFFTEEQFEAYRELGVHVAESLFLPALTGGNVRPANIAEWFRSLAGNLLETGMS